MNAIGMYIFGGSQTIGHLLSGWNIDTILEMTEDMKEKNAYNFCKNYKDINVMLPSQWNNDEYKRKLKNKQYDLLFSNPPCSGLSQINRNASANSDINNHIYEVVDIINEIEPKVFLIENAPTLINLGLPILKNIEKILHDKYKIMIISDYAGNHNVCMQRRRTLVVGWNKVQFYNKLPKITQKKEIGNLRDVLHIIGNEYNLEFSNPIIDEDFFKFYNLVPPSDSILKILAINYDKIKDDLNDKQLQKVLSIKNKMKVNANIWDKSSYRLDYNYFAPSITSISQFMHPIENRDLYIREYARIMGYPDEFIFYPEECKCSIIQCIAQGVPVNFIRYISIEIMKSFSTNDYFDENIDVVYINQTKGTQEITTFTNEDFVNCNKINENRRYLITI